VRSNLAHSLFAGLLSLTGCSPGTESPAPQSLSASSSPAVTPAAPDASTTGGFDAARAVHHTRYLVELGPRPPGSDAIHKAQAYIAEQLRSAGCQVSEQQFVGHTTLGDIGMKNVVAVAPGRKPDIVLYGAHYDTVRIPNFVGANDGAGGAGVLLELARHFCAKRNDLTVWMAFFDGEEAQGNWNDGKSIRWTNENSTMGSREMAARMSLSGDLERARAMILVDMVAGRDSKLKRDSGSTTWLNDLIWGVAARLGYQKIFVSEMQTVGGDDHFSFIKRRVAATDLVDMLYAYWHTPQDTLDKLDPQNIAITGHVLLESLSALQQKFR
jgi:glutaminyl-peptide cyclotransferase